MIRILAVITPGDYHGFTHALLSSTNPSFMQVTVGKILNVSVFHKDASYLLGESSDLFMVFEKKKSLPRVVANKQGLELQFFAAWPRPLPWNRMADYRARKKGQGERMREEWVGKRKRERKSVSCVSWTRVKGMRAARLQGSGHKETSSSASISPFPSCSHQALWRWSPLLYRWPPWFRL